MFVFLDDNDDQILRALGILEMLNVSKRLLVVDLTTLLECTCGTVTTTPNKCKHPTNVPRSFMGYRVYLQFLFFV